MALNPREHISNLPHDARAKIKDGRVYFYALRDPITNECRYIGKTVRPVTRYRRHIVEAETKKRDHHCARWIRIVLGNGLFPQMEILETLVSEDGWEEREKFWISYYRSTGANLTNIMDGGQGAQNPSQEWRENVRQRMKGNSFAVGMRHTDETKERIRQGHLGRKFTDEHKKKINWLGRKHKPETIEKMRNRIVSKETREKMSMARRARILVP